MVEVEKGPLFGAGLLSRLAPLGGAGELYISINSPVTISPTYLQMPGF